MHPLQALEAIRGADLAVACGGAAGQEMSDRSSLQLEAHDFLQRLAAQAEISIGGYKASSINRRCRVFVPSIKDRGYHCT